MTSKHLRDGRRTLRDFEANLKKCNKALPFAPEPPSAPEVPPNTFPEWSGQQIGDRISSLDKTWFLKDGTDRHVSQRRRKEQRSARIELIQLRIEFMKRLNAENLDPTQET